MSSGKGGKKGHRERGDLVPLFYRDGSLSVDQIRLNNFTHIITHRYDKPDFQFITPRDPEVVKQKVGSFNINGIPLPKQ